MKLSQEACRSYSTYSLLSNHPLKHIMNNLDGIFHDSTRILFELDNNSVSAKCFNRLQTIRKEHINNKELLGLLIAPLLGNIYQQLIKHSQNKNCHDLESNDNNNSDIKQNQINFKMIKTTIEKMGAFIHKFKMKMPVFKRYFTSQGVGSSISISGVSVDSFDFLEKCLYVNDFVNDAYLMSLFYFVTLFGKEDPHLDERFFQNYLFSKLIISR